MHTRTDFRAPDLKVGLEEIGNDDSMYIKWLKHDQLHGRLPPHICNSSGEGVQYIFVFREEDLVKRIVYEVKGMCKIEMGEYAAQTKGWR